MGQVGKGLPWAASAARIVSTCSSCSVVPKEGKPKDYERPHGSAPVSRTGINMPIPQKLLRQGVRDMIRISDARMSGTA
jgi:L-arabonate dehydrase